MLIIILSLSLLFIFLTHPLSAGFIILLQTLLISILTGTMNLNFWFSYILFLILIGGMMILFIYMTSIASNEKFKFSMNLLILLMIFSYSMYLIYSPNTMIYQNFDNIYILLPTLNKFINSNLLILFYLMIIYLLITLIAIVSMMKTLSSPLRQMN
uniref:NADH dehydrogenase subunit 6 n=1 Tax=Coleoptera sp. ACP-2013 TaxID=2485033 RepID=A0A3G3MEB2_9COLE|nr:NADH dehydrogenase subunit 6 [Coleoptera sp. ACP-2013]